MDVSGDNTILVQEVQTMYQRWQREGVLGLTSGHGISPRTIEIRQTKILPKDPGFIDAIIAQLRHLPWVAKVVIQQAAARKKHIQAIKTKLLPSLEVGSLRPFVHSVLNNLDRLTDQQLEEVKKELDTAE